MCLTEKMQVLDELPSARVIELLAQSPTLVNQQYILNKVSLNRNTLKIRLHVVTRDLQGPNPALP